MKQVVERSVIWLVMSVLAMFASQAFAACIGINCTSQDQAQAQAQTQGQAQGQQQGQIAVGVGLAGVNSSGSSNTVTNQINEPRQTPAAIAPGLAASSEACMGSTSMGGSGAMFGFSIGTTWKNADCERRQYAKTIAALGDMDAAKAMLCMDEKVNAAYANAGHPCKSIAEPKSKTTAQASPSAEFKKTSFMQ